MSRSGYSDDFGCDNYWDLIRWRGAVKSAFQGRRGQAFLKEMLQALDALPAPRLVENDLVREGGEVCAIGAVGRARGLDMSALNPVDRETVAAKFGIAPAMVAEIFFMNDDDTFMREESPEARFMRMRAWIASQILAEEE